MHFSHCHASFPTGHKPARERTATRRRAGNLPRALLATAIAGAVLSPSAFALNYEVSNTNDAGSGSLRDALNQANNSIGVADTITFASTLSGTIALTSGPLYASDAVDIQGPGAEQLTIDGSGLIATPQRTENRGRGDTYGIILVAAPVQQQSPARGDGPPPPNVPISLSGLTLTGAPTSAISAKYADLTVSNAVITGNGSLTQEVTPGGGAIIALDSSLVLSHSQITGNAAKYGGGIFQLGEMPSLIDQTTIAGNQAYAGAGAFITGNAVTITASTISGNIAQPPENIPYAPPYGVCAGLMLTNKYGPPVMVANSTISGNQAGVGAGLCAVGEVELSFATITGNTSTVSGGGISGPPEQEPRFLQDLRAARRGEGPPSSITARNSMIAGNSAPDKPDIDPNGVPTTLAYSLIGDLDGATIIDAGGNIFGQSAQLGPLADNGGPTLTHAPLDGSPLINAGDPAFTGPPNVDQRGPGFSRIVEAVVDIGSFEVQAAIIGPAPASPTPVPGLGDLGKWALGLLLGLFGFSVARRRALN